MYDINDKSAAIKEIQRYLSEHDGSVICSGVYDDYTARAVKEAQIKNGLPASGVADRITFEAIYADYRRSLAKKAAKRLSPRADFPLKFGDSGREVYNLNAMLSRIALYYGEANAIRGSFFGSESARITKRLREIFQLEVAEFVDEELYLRLIREEQKLHSNH